MRSLAGLSKALAIAGAVLIGIVAGASLFLSYDVRAAFSSLQRDTPQDKVDIFMSAVMQGDERAAMQAWQIPQRGYEPALAALRERRADVTRALLAMRPRTYQIEGVEWWSMCCMPHIIESSRYASGARFTVNVDGTRYRVDAFALDHGGVYDGLPASRWVMYDVYPVDQRPLYNTFPGR